MPQSRTPPAKATAGAPANESATSRHAGEVDPANPSANGQSHPLYSIDRATVDRLLAAQTPEDDDLIDAARLLTRYNGFPGAFDLQDDLRRAIRHWGLGTDDLQARARALWQGGYRVGAKGKAAEPVGSGFDTAADTES
jgi:hypothetical protein